MATLADLYGVVAGNPNQQYGLADIASLGVAGLMDFTTSIYPQVSLGPVTASGQEWANLIRFLFNEPRIWFDQRTVSLYERKFPQIAVAALTAKAQLANGTLGPVTVGTIIPQLIRPVTVYASTGASKENWLASAVTAGWGATPFFTVDLNTSTSGSITLTPQNRVVMLILAVGDMAGSPNLFEFQFYDQANRPLGVHTMPWIHMGGNTDFQELQEAILIQVNAKTSMYANFEATGSAIPELFGVQFVTAEYATAQ